MMILSKQIQKSKKRRSVKEKEKPVKVSLGKIKLSNSNLVFSLGIEAVISMPNQANSSPNGTRECSLSQYGNTETSDIQIRVINTDDLEIKKEIDKNLDNLAKIQQIIDTHASKIQQIYIPYVRKDGYKQDDLEKFAQEASFSPKSFKDRSTPENLTVYAMVVHEDTSGNSRILSDTFRQEVISNNNVLLAGNIVDVRSLKFEDYLKFDIVNQVTENREAYFSDQFCSIDPSGFVKFIFLWDKVRFLREKSLFGNILKHGSIEAATNKMISDSRISDIRIIRKRVKKNIDGFSLYDKNQKNPVVAYSSDDPSGDLINSKSTNVKPGAIKSKIQSIAPSQSLFDYRIFAVDDYYAQKNKIGMYKYEVNVRCEDGMLKFLISSLEDLRKIDKKLESYQNIFPNSGIIASDIKDCVSEMLQVLFSIRGLTVEQMSSIREEFLSLASHFEGFQKIISFNMELMTKIDYALGKRGVVKQGGKGKTYSSSASKLFFLEDSQEFSEVVDYNTISTIKSDYFGMTSVDSVGITNFTKDEIEERFMDEFKKGISTSDSYGDINFADLNEKMRTSNIVGSANASNSNLFDFSGNFFSYLSPATTKINGKTIKNENFNPLNYTATDNNQLLDLSFYMASKGIRVLTSRETILQKSNDLREPLCGEELFGLDSPVNIQKTYQNNENVTSKQSSNEIFTKIDNSSAILMGISKYYNNFNLQRGDYDLDSPLSLVEVLRTDEREQLYLESIEEMPNQLRVLFGSKSDLVRNKWNLMDNDFFANPVTLKMMQENYSNLIKIEVLRGFEKDSTGQPNIQLPIFKKLQISDINEMRSGQILICRTYKVSNQSLGLGQQKSSNKSENYYNKYFTISLEGGSNG